MNLFPYTSSNEVSRKLTIGLSKVSNALKKQAWINRTKTGLNPTQSQILSYLLLRKGLKTRLGDVAAHLNVTPATVSDSVSSLQRKMLVNKCALPGDAREVSISLTELGSRSGKKATALPEQIIEASQTLSTEEQGTFLKSLMKIVRHLQENGQISVSRMCITCKYFNSDVYKSAQRPHHCGFVDAAFGDRELRMDCPDHLINENNETII